VECVQFRTLLLLLLLLLLFWTNVILRPDPHESTLATSRGFASRLLRMKGLVTPWLLIATGMRIFLIFFLRESASSRQEVSESAH